MEILLLLGGVLFMAARAKKHAPPETQRPDRVETARFTNAAIAARGGAGRPALHFLGTAHPANGPSVAPPPDPNKLSINGVYDAYTAAGGGPAGVLAGAGYVYSTSDGKAAVKNLGSVFSAPGGSLAVGLLGATVTPK